MKAKLELVKIGKEEDNYHSPELCIINIKLFKPAITGKDVLNEDGSSYEFEVATTGLSDFRLTKGQNHRLNLKNIETLINWLGYNEGGILNRSKVYDFVKEKFKAHRQLKQKLAFENIGNQKLQ